MRFRLNQPLLFFTLLLVLALSTACGPSASTPGGNPVQTATATPTRPASATTPVPLDACPHVPSINGVCFTPRALRVAYGIQALTEQGFSGKGQTVIDIVSYGSPTLQKDMDVFDKQFGLPPITLQVVAPLGTVPYDPNNKDMFGWAAETNLDVQIIHAIAPDANIVVMTSPVDETEGTIGLPEFLQLEQYAVSHHLGQIFSQSYAASEATLSDSAGRQLVQKFADFYKQITTQQGFTILSGSGDQGATDYADVGMTHLSTTPTVNFPADVPWVTAVGGTTLLPTSFGYTESAWSGSGGGRSQFFSEPDFQKGLPSAVQTLLAGSRGMPDIAGDSNPSTGMAFYINGQWLQAGGTSASTPLWAGIVAVANQVAGHPLGFINPGLYRVAMSQNAQKDFRDITSGSNTVTRSTMHVQGFSAQAGWDAVTGCGTPLGSQLIPDLIAALK